MAIYTPRSIERDNQNALRKYPFADAAACGNGACTIPAGAVIDAQLYVHGRDPGRVWMSSIDTDGKLHFSDDAGEFAETTVGVEPDAAVPVTFTGDGGPLPGGVVVLGKEDDVSVLRSFGGQSFSAEDTELAAAAVTFTGLKGVHGFRLDDGNVVSGKVKIRGLNGCDVATYVGADGRGYLQISAIGRTIDTQPVTGFIKRVEAVSNNRHFVLSVPNDEKAPEYQLKHVIQIQLTGAMLTRRPDRYVDQDDLCGTVRKTRGTTPNPMATVPPWCGNGICDTGIKPLRTIKFMVDGHEEPVTKKLYYGQTLGRVDIPDVPDGNIFTGYFKQTATPDGDIEYERYYKADGNGVGVFKDDSDITLHANYIASESRVGVDFEEYGTLHLNAPSVPGYSNPLHISGVTSPIPVIQPIAPDLLEKGGADALAELILHPSEPCGEVKISIRGIDKAYST